MHNRVIIFYVILLCLVLANPPPDSPSQEIEANALESVEIVSPEIPPKRSWMARMRSKFHREQKDVCQCCFANKGKTRCSHGHAFCKTCLRSRFGDLDAPLQCFAAVDQKCDGDLDMEAIARKLPPTIVKYYRQLKNTDPSLVKSCIKCGHETAVVDPKKVQLTCLRHGCGYRGCTKCDKDITNDKTAHECYHEKARKAAEDAMFQAVSSANGIRNCPGCKRPFIKNGGCDHMICRCGMNFQIQQAPVPSGSKTATPGELKKLAEDAIQKYVKQNAESLTPAQLDAISKIRIRPEDMIAIMPDDPPYDTVHVPASPRTWKTTNSKNWLRKLKSIAKKTGTTIDSIIGKIFAAIGIVAAGAGIVVVLSGMAVAGGVLTVLAIPAAVIGISGFISIAILGLLAKCCCDPIWTI